MRFSGIQYTCLARIMRKMCVNSFQFLPNFLAYLMIFQSGLSCLNDISHMKQYYKCQKFGKKLKKNQTCIQLSINPIQNPSSMYLIHHQIVCTPPWTSLEHKKLPDAAPLLRLQKQSKHLLLTQKFRDGHNSVNFQGNNLNQHSSQGGQQQCTASAHVAPAPLSYTHKKGVKYVFKRGQCFVACAMMALVAAHSCSIVVNSWKYIHVFYVSVT